MAMLNLFSTLSLLLVPPGEEVSQGEQGPI
jgi:hypothetical protein